MGIVLLGLAAMNETGLHGAVFQMVSHGLIAALMFLVIGVIEVRTGTTNLKELGGLAKPMPFISGFFLASALASLGLPGLSGFVSEFLAYLGLFQKMPVMAAIGALGLVLTAAYVLRATLSATFGQVPAAFAGLEEARVYEAVPMVILLALVILIGVYPSVLQAPIQETLVNIVERIGG
jgi:NADH-quinone oxidoreductase subunit M